LAEVGHNSEARRLLAAAKSEFVKDVECEQSLKGRRARLETDDKVLRTNLYNALIEQCQIQLQLNLDGEMKNRGALFLNLRYTLRR
jgi:hypothetical protein